MGLNSSRALPLALVLKLLVASSLLTLSLISAQAQVDNRDQRRSIRIKPVDGNEIDLYNESHALVIGVAEYTRGLPNLPGVRGDIADVAAALKRQGFEVETLLNPTRTIFDQGVRTFIRKRGQVAGNRLLIYFAGHGHTLKTGDGREVGFIVPTDAPLPTRDLPGFKESAISMDEIESYARRIESKHVLFIFDSCFSGSLFEAMRTIPDAIASKTALPVRQFITAGTSEQAVPDDSIFSKQLVSGMKGDADLNRDGYVTGSELGMFLENSVANYSRGSQTPRYGKIRDPKLDKGDFVFVLPGEPKQIQTAKESETKPLSVDPTLIEITFWTSIQSSTNPNDFTAYLAKYPGGHYAELARNRLKTLEASVKSPASPATGETYVKSGDALMANGKWAEAQREYQRAVELSPGNITSRAKLASSLMAQRKFVEAETQYRRMLEQDSNNALWHFNLGQSLVEQQRYAEAETELKEAVRIAPNNLQFKGTLAQLTGRLSASQPKLEAPKPEAPRSEANLKSLSNENSIPSSDTKDAELQAVLKKAIQLARTNQQEDSVAELRKAIKARNDQCVECVDILGRV